MMQFDPTEPDQDAGAPGGAQPSPEVSFPDQPAGPPPTPWTFREMFYFLVFIGLAIVVSSVAATAGYAALAPVMHWRATPKDAQSSPFFLLVLQALLYGLIFLYVYLVVAVKYGQPFWTALHWRNPGARGVWLYFLGGFALALSVQFFPTVLPDKQNFPLRDFFNTPAVAYAAGAFAILVAPFMEELIFRGFLFSVFERQVGLMFAVGATAVLFALLHVPEYSGAWNHVLLILFVGVVFSLARGLTDSLAPSVILHLTYNLSLMAGLFFQTQHFRVMQGVLAAVIS